MAFKIVNGKLVKIDINKEIADAGGTVFGIGTLGLGSGTPTPKAKKEVAKKLSNIFDPPQSLSGAGGGGLQRPKGLVPRALRGFGAGDTVAGRDPAEALRRNLQRSGGISGTLGLGQPTSLRSPLLPPLDAPRAQPRSLGEALAMQEPGPLRFMAGGSLAAEERSRAPSPIQFGRGGFGEAVPQAQARLQPPPNIIEGTGPTPIQVGDPAVTLGDLDPLFPPGTVISRAGGTTAAQLPDGRIVDLTRVETYGQLVAESLFRAIEIGNPDLRSTNIREEWAMSFKHLWEDNYENVSDFLTAMGYRQVPGTNNWIRENPMDLTSPTSLGSGLSRIPTRIIRGGGGGFGGFGGGGAARGQRISNGLVNWRI